MFHVLLLLAVILIKNDDKMIIKLLGSDTAEHAHKHTHPFNGPFSGTN